VQSVITLAAEIVGTGRAADLESQFRSFVKAFVSELSRQVELGLKATDNDYIAFQRSVNANVRVGAKSRHEILLRKMFRSDPSLDAIFDPSMIAKTGVAGELQRIGNNIDDLVEKINITYNAKQGKDLFKSTTKTVSAQKRLQKPISSFDDYKDFISSAYFLFWEGPGERLNALNPQSFVDINELRTDMQHDVDHGKAGKVAAKRKKMSEAFKKYGHHPLRRQ
jgi:predicted DNA-binding protein YlxM (UPF0122 family)